MAGTGSDSQRQLLSLIRNFATEKSQGERRITVLKNQIEDLKSKLSSVNAELEYAKGSKELVEQELKGYEVQLFLSEASVQTLEARASLIQDEISTVGSDLETLKYNLYPVLSGNKIGSCRKGKTVKRTEIHLDFLSDASQGIMKDSDTKRALSTLEKMLAEIRSQTAKEEDEYKAEQNNHENIQQELNHSKRKLSLMDALVEEAKALQDLTIYPF
ncbi:hypothetical protein G2W53_042020 [Senna tora]|uniref:Uncharacterized protein n=1 Tax=Senna tora TaxID=362788 RepID=A0A834W3F9_9FABA|nr:hypothetical protein G2W53_042020 [Senna tora]